MPKPRQISATGLHFIQNYEGCRLYAYKPVAAETYWTIGWGHYGADVKQGATITQAQADQMFYNDMQNYVAGVNKLLKVDVTQNQFDALCSFAYNCGVGGLQKSTLLQYLNLGKIQAAADELPKFCHGAGGVVLQGLLTRRNKEREVFLTPDAGGEEEVLNDTELDFALAVLGDYWNRMNGNKAVQDETHRIANILRVAHGRKAT